ncbi:MAG: cupin domain-containing protein [Clostridiales bacterium]|nr:cupin domain-containing protein [Clostridiales bacterium]
MKIKRFDPLFAKPAHGGTILADRVIPEGMNEPFSHAYGYLLNGRSMMGHAHPTDEIYVVMSGTGHVIVGGRNAKVKTGDVAVIPPDEYHTMLCTEDDAAPFKWAALWWPHIAGEAGESTEEISVARFDSAGKASEPAVPSRMKTPFEHSFERLSPGEKRPSCSEKEGVYIILSGNADISAGNERAALSAGDVVGLPPGENVLLEAKSGDVFFVYLRWPVK